MIVYSFCLGRVQRRWAQYLVLISVLNLMVALKSSPAGKWHLCCQIHLHAGMHFIERHLWCRFSRTWYSCVICRHFISVALFDHTDQVYFQRYGFATATSNRSHWSLRTRGGRASRTKGLMRIEWLLSSGSLSFSLRNSTKSQVYFHLLVASALSLLSVSWDWAIQVRMHSCVSWQKSITKYLGSDHNAWEGTEKTKSSFF